jgi:hypothetical protein
MRRRACELPKPTRKGSKAHRLPQIHCRLDDSDAYENRFSKGKAMKLQHFPWRLPEKQLWQPTISSSPVTKSKSQKLANAWRKIKKSCLPSMAFPPNIGRILRTTTLSNPSAAADYRRTANSPNQGFRFTNRDSDNGSLNSAWEAQKHWRRLQGFELIPKVVTGVRRLSTVRVRPTPRGAGSEFLVSGCRGVQPYNGHLGAPTSRRLRTLCR